MSSKDSFCKYSMKVDEQFKACAYWSKIADWGNTLPIKPTGMLRQAAF